MVLSVWEENQAASDRISEESRTWNFRRDFECGRANGRWRREKTAGESEINANKSFLRLLELDHGSRFGFKLARIQSLLDLS